MELEQWLSAQQKQDTGISLWIHTQDHLGLEKLFSQLSKSKKSLIGFTPGFFDFLERIDASASLASSVNTSASSSDEIFLKFSETRLESPFSNLCNYLEGWINSEVLLKSLSPFKGQKVLQAKCIVKLGSAPDTMNSLLLAQLPLPLFDTERLNIPFRKEEDLYSRKLWEKLSQ